MFSHILVAIDGSTHAIAAADVASDLARHYDARVTLMYVTRPSELAFLPKELFTLVKPDLSPHRPQGLPSEVVDEILKRAAERVAARGVDKIETVLESGDPAARIVDYAHAHEVNLIVLGRRGLSEIKGLLMGSVSTKVLSLANCACLTVK